VINANGTGERRLSPTPGFDANPSWSPDGTKIIYTHLLQRPLPDGPAPMTDIDIMNANGTGNHTILANTRFSVEPRWSSRNQIVFMSLMDSASVPGLQIYVMNPDGTGLRRLTSGANNAEPAWSPDGARIAFGSDRQGDGKLNLFVMNAEGGNVRQLTHFNVPDEAGVADWSPDGTAIAFQCDVDGGKESSPTAFTQIWTINTDGTGARDTGIQCSDIGCDPRWRPN
jgi:Tol biopolymer transport system component